MSFGTKNPLRFMGANVSGAPNTGELLTVRGGTRRCTVWSGSLAVTPAAGTFLNSSGGQIQFWSGPGRLNSIVPLSNSQSGLPTFFYDANAIAVSGVVGLPSGFIGAGSLSTQYLAAAASGVFQVAQIPSEPFRPDCPFFNGLCASIASGTNGFTVTWTPEVDPTNPNQ